MAVKNRTISAFSQALIVTLPSVTIGFVNAKIDFSNRFNTALDLLPAAHRPPSKGGGRQTAVAKMFGVSQKGARKWLEGEAIPSTSRMPEFESKLKVSAAWLWTGRGSKELSQPTDSISSTVGNLLPRVTPRSREALEAITAAAEAGQLSDADLDLLQRIAQRFQQPTFTPAPLPDGFDEQP